MKQSSVKNKSMYGLSLWLLALICMSLVLVACDDDKKTPTPVPPTSTVVQPTATATPAVVDPAVVAKEAADKLPAVKTLHFLLDVKQGKVEIIQGVTFNKVEGDYEKESKFDARLKVNVVVGQFDARVIGIGNEQFLSIRTFAEPWRKLPPEASFNPAILFDQQKGLGTVLASVKDIKLVGEEQIDGVDCYKLQGTADGKQIAPLTLSSIGTKGLVDFTLWTGKTDRLTRRVDLKEQTAPSSTEPPNYWQLNFSKFDDPNAKKIERPQGV